MKHVVIMTVITETHTKQGMRQHTRNVTIPAFDKRDAMALAAALSSHCASHYEDRVNDAEHRRDFEPGCVFHTRKGSVTLTQDDMEMIAQQYTAD